ncbi:hypothetical protein [Candidatus Williamhamiltonella defendens]|uniref:hypothetical protein n=1 Tax=Candidatus Williamhamiltonella defendens TaxID=138072 RepID=UPI0012FE1F82|nr:hypothetical protein [Candidatus Hamiltonella defensa]
MADIRRVESLNTGWVHLIDREGDSVGHMRELSAQGICWLIRGKEGHRAEWGGSTRKIGEIADVLPLIACGQIGWKGKNANMEIGETSVIITRTAKPKRKNKSTGRRVKVQLGVALTIRLVAVRLTDTDGNFIGRWSIDSFFKLLKGAGHDVEKWLQRSAGAVLRRLYVYWYADYNALKATTM